MTAASRPSQPLPDHRKLVDVAMGRAPADLIVRGGRWVCVQSGEIVPDIDIAVAGERVAFVGPDASHTRGEGTRIVDANGRYLVPGLLDAHMHVESSMVTVTEFVRAVLPRGTTGLFIDPHEIANVFGLEGVRLMVEEAAVQPIHVWVQVPSCVPSAPGLETPGAGIGPEDVAEAMSWAGVIGLGEMMNFPGVYQGDSNVHAILRATRETGKVIGGHYAADDLGLPFHGYAAGGAEDDHEGTRREDAVARVRQGMKVMLRLGSAWFDVAEQSRAITEMGLDPRRFLLCTDDSHSGTLVRDGHMDRVVRHAISRGLRPITAIQMATINTAEHFRLSRHMGMIAPGRFADILLVPSLPEFQAELVIARGNVAAEAGRLSIDPGPFPYPEWARRSVRLSRPLVAEDFRLSPGGSIDAGEMNQSVTANVIGVIENQAPTRHLRFAVPLRDDEVRVSGVEDLAKVALVERHRGNGGIQVGLVRGFGFDRPCAVATTVAHDSHHMIVVGTDEADMALAANRLAEIGGGQIVVSEGDVLGLVALPIAGLMSEGRAEEVAEQATALLQGFAACGCTMNNPNMQLSLLALVVIPELRISDLGLVDVKQFDFIPVLEP